MTAIEPLRHLCLANGVFLRREALTLGIDDGALRRAVRGGQLVRVRHGAYTLGELWDTASAVERHVLLARAVMRAHPDRVALSHHSAAVVHGFDTWGLPLARVHVTRLDAGAGRVAGDVTHHEGLALPEDLVDVRGLRSVTPARAALESASLLGVERGLVIADSGLRLRLFDAQELALHASLMDSWPHSLKLQLVSRLADGRSGSVGESRSRYLFWLTGLPAPELQYAVHDERGLAGIADFAWPEHGLLGEFDGRVKYERLLREGETPSDAVFREKQREDRLRRATNWRVVRITWDMLSAPQQTSALIRSMLRNAA